MNERGMLEKFHDMLRTHMEVYFQCGPTVDEAARYISALTDFSIYVDDLLLDAARRFERVNELAAQVAAS